MWFGGCTVVAKGVSESHAFGAEFLASFLVVFVVFSCYEKTKYDQQSQAAPFVIGLIYAAAIIATVKTSNVSAASIPDYIPKLNTAVLLSVRVCQRG